MRTPKILPWLARKAGVSEARAADLWFDAIRHATEVTGWVGTSEYWRVANERLLELLEVEKQATRCEARSNLPVVAERERYAMPGLPHVLLSFLGARAGTAAFH